MLVALLVGALLAGPTAAGAESPTLGKREAWRALWRKDPPLRDDFGNRISVRNTFGGPEFRRIRRDVVRISLGLWSQRHRCWTAVVFGVRERSEGGYSIRERGDSLTICLPPDGPTGFASRFAGPS
jgi:hypothetical protein